MLLCIALLPRGYQKVKFNPLIACPRPRGKKLPPTSWGLAMADGAIDNPSSPSILSLVVKFGARSFPLSLPSDSTVKDLKTLLQPLTNVIPRGQKLIFKGNTTHIYLHVLHVLFNHAVHLIFILLKMVSKWFVFLQIIFLGKVLTDAMSMGSAQVSNGSKIMLMASRGLHQGVFNVFYCILKPLISGEVFMICLDFPPREFTVCCMISFVS